MSPYDICPDGLMIRIYAQPGTRKTGFAGLFKDRVKIKVACPPVEGKANKELKKFLASACDVSKSKVVLIKGDRSRDKSILIRIDAEQTGALIKKIEKLVSEK